MILAASALAAGEAPASGPEGGDLGLSFEALFRPVQMDWRGAVVPASGGATDGAAAAGPETEEPGLTAGYVWEGDGLSAGGLDGWFPEEESVFVGGGIIVGRSTALRDGGIDGARASLGGEALAGYAEPGGEFDLYDISMRIGSLGSKRIGVDFITGFRAVDARVGRTHSERTEAGDMQTTLDLARGVVTIPIVGMGVHWQPSERVSFSGAAATHTMSDRATFYDLTAQAEVQIRPNVGFVAGYQYVRSAMEVRQVPAELDEEGLFARIQIRF